MLDKHNLEKILFIDIETTSGRENFNELTERQQELFLKSMKNKGGSEAITEDQKQELYNRLAPIFCSEYGKIICISVGKLIKTEDASKYKVKMISFVDKDEKRLLTNFTTKLNVYLNDNSYILCGHNILVFDLPVIARRLLVNGISLPKQIDFAEKKPWDLNAIDLKRFWSFLVFDNNVSLDTLCDLFNIESPKSDMNGADVKKVYYSDEKNSLERIKNYCEMDVKSVMRLFVKLRCLEEEIVD